MKKKLISIFLTFIMLFVSMVLPLASAYAQNIKPPKSTSLTHLSGGNKQVTVKWKKVKGVSGYQIQYSKSSKFKKSKKINVNDTDKTKKIIKHLNQGTKYYFRIRTYKVKNNDKVYSSWSKKKSAVAAYWCDEGGTHHSMNTGLGWYKTYDEARKAGVDYIKKGGGTRYEVQQCEYCDLYTVYVK